MHSPSCIQANSPMPPEFYVAYIRYELMGAQPARPPSSISGSSGAPTSLTITPTSVPTRVFPTLDTNALAATTPLSVRPSPYPQPPTQMQAQTLISAPTRLLAPLPPVQNATPAFNLQPPLGFAGDHISVGLGRVGLGLGHPEVGNQPPQQDAWATRYPYPTTVVNGPYRNDTPVMPSTTHTALFGPSPSYASSSSYSSALGMRPTFGLPPPLPTSPTDYVGSFKPYTAPLPQQKPFVSTLRAQQPVWVRMG